MTTPTITASGGRFSAVEAALYAEYGVESRVAWTFLTSQVEISRIDARPISSSMFARFESLWAAQAGGERWAS